MRALGLLFVACAALGACGKKPAPKAPPPPADPNAAPAPAPPPSQPIERKGDPCEGGEKPQ